MGGRYLSSGSFARVLGYVVNKRNGGVHYEMQGECKSNGTGAWAWLVLHC